MHRPLIAALPVLLLASGVAQAKPGTPRPAPSPAVPTPTVEGPITGGLRDHPGMASVVDPVTFGYREDEYFVGGTAVADGDTTLLLPTVPVDDGATSAYKTRVLVRRPADPARFNGTVLVEWVNVTTQWDGDPAWVANYRRLLVPEGWAYVGVSAQRAGVEAPSPLALKVYDPVRYASLNHPSDYYAYDIFTQVAKAVIADPKPLGGLRPKIVIGSGVSQSATFLNGYLGSYYKKAWGIFDGFAPAAMKADTKSVPVPTIWMNSQSETTKGPSTPDSDLLRVWEVAGAHHADHHTVNEGVLAHAAWDGTGQRAAGAAVIATSNDDYQTRTRGQSCSEHGSTNLFPYRYAAPVQHVWLERWIRTGKAAPSMPRHERLADGALKYDADGNVYGGFRLPVIDVPVATYTTKDCGSLDGTSVRFSEARLRELYPTHDAYVTKLQAAVDRAVRAGYLFPGDAIELMAIARSSSIPDVE